MKILEISGCNLASLKGEFRIALDQPPFSRDGLFAIRGVTGSGKSTLIDAMCLALYDDTPRFVGRGGPKIGLATQDEKDRIAATDSRSILHRGASQGWAQVVFRGVDDRCWRTKWSVSKAHKKADGRFKSQELELEDLEAKQLRTGNRTEILKLIGEKVGLTFEQFRRSVLLAQGEFAAFAKANEDDRAGLLEAMTGTGIYAQLSMAAQKRSSLADQQLKDLHIQRDALGLLSQEARNEKEAQADALVESIGQQEKEQSEVMRNLGWYARCDELERLRAEAASKVENADTAFEVAKERRHQLQRVDLAQPLRPLHANLARTRDHQVSLENQIKDRQAPLPVAKQAQKELADGFQERQAVLAKAVEAIATTKPDLDAARDLDTLIQEAQAQIRSISEDARKLDKEAISAEQTRDASVREEQSLSKQLEKVSEELEASRSLQPLTQSWSRIEEDVQSFAKNRRALNQTAASLAKIRESSKLQEGTRSSLHNDLAELASSLSQQEVELDSLTLQLAKEPREALEALRKERQTSLDQVRSADGVLQRLQPLLSLLAAAEEEARTQAAAKANATHLEDETNQNLLTLEGGLNEAKSALERAQAALSLEDHRHRLVDGEPCPLCGSPEHPWSQGSPLEGLIEGQRQKVSDLDQKRIHLEQERAKARTQMAQAEKAEAKARKDAQAHASGVGTEEQAWIGLRSMVSELPVDARSPHASTWVRERVLDLVEQLAEIAKRGSALLTIEKRAEQLRREQRENLVRRKTLDEKTRLLDEEIQRLKVLEAEHARDITNQESVLRGLRDSLAVFLDANDIDGLERDPESIRMRLAAQVEKRQESEATQVELTKKLGELAKMLEGQRATAGEKRHSASVGETKRKDAEKSLDSLQEQRKGYLGGCSVAEVEKALEEHRKASEKAVEMARTDLQAADKALGELHHGIAALQEQWNQASTASKAALDAFRDAIAHDWEGAMDELEACLAWTQQQIQGERTALQAIETERSKARAVLDEYQRALDAHRNSEPPAQTREELDALSASLKAALDELQRALGGLQADLLRDDQARGNAAALAGAIQEQQDRTKLWNEMNTLIGSSDGKKFRTFAQSLTLEALVSFANEQLTRLNPRYRLQRVPNYELELQVIDQDMGDEIRALNSLSGGETFLVSLALALGLSSLSASDTPIDSLFIDEGFGTLDSETLETALSVLDELQSQGRQVGIISHVDGLATHIPVQISVEKLGGGRSRVVLPLLGRAG